MRKYWENPSEENKQNIIKLLAANFTKYRYVNGTRPGNKEIQLALSYDYQNSLKQYPTWHEYFRKYQPPTLVA